MMLDALDHRLLAALADDARASYRRLAHIAGTTPPTAIARIHRMEDLGILRGFRPVLAPPPGTVYECVTDGTPPPGEVLERVAYDDGVRWTCLGDGVEEWAHRHGVQVHRVESVSVQHQRPGPAMCHQCHGPLPERPIEQHIAGRRHVFCCTTCRDRMRDRARQMEGKDQRERASSRPDA